MTVLLIWRLPDDEEMPAVLEVRDKGASIAARVNAGERMIGLTLKDGSPYWLPERAISAIDPGGSDPSAAEHEDGNDDDEQDDDGCADADVHGPGVPLNRRGES